MELESRLLVSRGCREGEMEMSAHGYGVSFWSNENVVVMVANSGENILNTTELYAFGNHEFWGM